MKKLIKEIGIVPSILILIAIGVGSTFLFSCNDEHICGLAGASCPGGTEACCEGLECVDERCCVSTGDALGDGATADDCCSGSSKISLPSPDHPDGGEICCAGEGQTAETHSECCDGLYWNGVSVCHACVETGEEVPGDHVPCCDPDANIVDRRQPDGTYITLCEPAPVCPCGELPGSATFETGVRCREPCPTFPEDIVVPTTCVPCEDPFGDPDCQQVIVTTRDYCANRDDPQAACRLVTVRAGDREEAEICAADLACVRYEFTTGASGACAAEELSAILLEAVGLPYDTVHPMNTALLEQACDDYCAP